MKRKIRHSILIFLLIAALTGACSKKNDNNSPSPNAPSPNAPSPLPTVNTKSVTYMGSGNKAYAVGEATAEGNSVITSVGFCWSQSPNPTLLNNQMSAGAGIGRFDAEISPLNSNTKYYVRAYATNLNGTAYGNEISYTTTP
jgi:hypothetical protein